MTKRPGLNPPSSIICAALGHFTFASLSSPICKSGSYHCIVVKISCNQVCKATSTASSVNGGNDVSGGGDGNDDDDCNESDDDKGEEDGDDADGDVISDDNVIVCWWLLKEFKHQRDGCTRKPLGTFPHLKLYQAGLTLSVGIG